MGIYLQYSRTKRKTRYACSFLEHKPLTPGKGGGGEHTGRSGGAWVEAQLWP